MVELQAILKYQEIDKRLYALERDLAGCDERKEYVKTKKFLETAADKLDAYDAKAAGLKNQAIELTNKYLKTEDTLKDFSNIDELVEEGGADIAFYKKNALALSDKLKKIKAELNELTASVNATHEEYQKLKRQVIAMQKQYKDAFEKYNAVKASKEGERRQIESELKAASVGISPETMEKYKNKRKERVFPVVGQLKGTRCPFCGMEPPLAARNKLTGGATIECDNCRRIIYSE
jgi:predicted  nucleic acid-binding Zn-ribbon protein